MRNLFYYFVLLLFVASCNETDPMQEVISKSLIVAEQQAVAWQIILMIRRDSYQGHTIVRRTKSLHQIPGGGAVVFTLEYCGTCMKIQVMRITGNWQKPLLLA